MDLRRRRPARSRVPRWLRPLLDPAALRYWLVVAVIAALLAAIVGRAVGAADQARARWGRSRPVLVAAHDLDGGAPLHRGDVRSVRWPDGLVPEGTLGRLPSGARIRSPVSAGSPLTATSLLRRGRDATSRGSVLAVPVDERSLHVHVGDLVELWAVPEGAADGETPSARRVAEGAEVVAVRTDAVTIAVEPAEVAGTALATATTKVVLVGSR